MRGVVGVEGKKVGAGFEDPLACLAAGLEDSGVRALPVPHLAEGLAAFVARGVVDGNHWQVERQSEGFQLGPDHGFCFGLPMIVRLLLMNFLPAFFTGLRCSSVSDDLASAVLLLLGSAESKDPSRARSQSKCRHKSASAPTVFLYRRDARAPETTL